VVVVPPSERLHVGNVEFLCLSEHSPLFNLSLVTIAAGRSGPPVHAHDAEDDAFLVLDDFMTFGYDGSEVVASAGTFVLIPPGVEHTFRNDTSAPVRMLNIHAPAGFDLRLRS
jgi:mannose-6-phosphate isomerase-like protein (cupin superfamily)